MSIFSSFSWLLVIFISGCCLLPAVEEAADAHERKSESALRYARLIELINSLPDRVGSPALTAELPTIVFRPTEPVWSLPWQSALADLRKQVLIIPSTNAVLTDHFDIRGMVVIEPGSQASLKLRDETGLADNSFVVFDRNGTEIRQENLLYDDEVSTLARQQLQATGVVDVAGIGRIVQARNKEVFGMHRFWPLICKAGLNPETVSVATEGSTHGVDEFASYLKEMAKNNEWDEILRVFRYAKWGGNPLIDRGSIPALTRILAENKEAMAMAMANNEGLSRYLMEHDYLSWARKNYFPDLMVLKWLSTRNAGDLDSFYAVIERDAHVTAPNFEAMSPLFLAGEDRAYALARRYATLKEPRAHQFRLQISRAIAPALVAGKLDQAKELDSLIQQLNRQDEELAKRSRYEVILDTIAEFSENRMPGKPALSKLLPTVIYFCHEGPQEDYFNRFSGYQGSFQLVVVEAKPGAREHFGEFSTCQERFSFNGIGYFALGHELKLYDQNQKNPPRSVVIDIDGRIYCDMYGSLILDGERVNWWDAIGKGAFDDLMRQGRIDDQKIRDLRLKDLAARYGDSKAWVLFSDNIPTEPVQKRQLSHFLVNKHQELEDLFAKTALSGDFDTFSDLAELSRNGNLDNGSWDDALVKIVADHRDAMSATMSSNKQFMTHLRGKRGGAVDDVYDYILLKTWERTRAPEDLADYFEFVDAQMVNRQCWPDFNLMGTLFLKGGEASVYSYMREFVVDRYPFMKSRALNGLRPAVASKVPLALRLAKEISEVDEKRTVTPKEENHQAASGF
jgi:hypothetical protein